MLRQGLAGADSVGGVVVTLLAVFGFANPALAQREPDQVIGARPSASRLLVALAGVQDSRRGLPESPDLVLRSVELILGAGTSSVRPRLSFAFDVQGSINRDWTGAATPATGALAAQVEWRPASRWTISLRQDLDAASRYGVGTLGVAPRFEAGSAPDLIDLRLNTRDVWRTTSGLLLRRRLSSRSDLLALAEFLHDRARADTAVYRRHAFRSGIRWLHRRSPHVAWRLGYVAERGRHGDAAEPVQHEIEAGLEMQKPLGTSRRLRLMALPGLSLDSERSADGEKTTSRLIATGRLALERDIGRSWLLLAGAERSAARATGLTRPSIANDVFALVEGQLTPHLRVHASGTARRGTIGLTGDRLPYRSFDVQGGMRWTFGSSTAVFAQIRRASLAVESALGQDGRLSDSQGTTVRVGLSWISAGPGGGS